MKTLHFALLCSFFLFFSNYKSATRYARSTGDWDSPSTWSNTSPTGGSCGCTPASGDDVVIDGYTVTIDAGTGNVTVLSVMLASNLRDASSALIVEDGMVLTVTGDFTIRANRATRDQTLRVMDNNTRIDVGDDFFIDEDTGNDLVIDIEDTGEINIVDDVIADRDGGDDLHLRLNENTGTSAEFNVGGDFTMTIDNFDSDGIIFLVNAAASQFDVNGTFSLSAATAASDVGTVNFDINDGSFNVDGNMIISRADDCGNINFDLDGGLLHASSFTVNSAGTLSANTGVRFFLDGIAEVDITNDLDVNMNGGDDFVIFINDNIGISAEFHIGDDFLIDKVSGDDIEIRLYEDDSELDIIGDFIITSTGGEQTDIELDNDATLLVGGDFAINHSQGQDIAITLQGGTDFPFFGIGGDASIIVTGGGDDVNVNLLGGLFGTGDDCIFTQGAGGDDFTFRMDGTAAALIIGDFINTLSGGDDMSFGLGENTVGSTAYLAVLGHMQMIHNNNVAASLMNFRIYDDTQVEVTQLTLRSNFTAPALFLTEVDNNAVLDINGNLNFVAVGGGEVELQISSAGKMEIMGSIIRQAAPNRFGTVDCAATGTIEWNGFAPQTMAADAGNGGDQIYYYSVIINNVSGSNPQVTLEGASTINNNILFTDGVVASTSANPLIIADNATSTGASNASHVDGIVRKVGNDIFDFPVGDDNNYQPISISAPALATDAFEARYFEVDPSPTYNDASKAVSLDHVSSCEYWTLDRTAGTSNVFVTLNWDANSCGVNSLPDLRVARWNGTSWQDHGNGATTGNSTAGTIRTAAQVTAFSPFTLASATALNPLPVTLVSFEAHLINTKVDLKWITAVETNNSHFEIERSSDGQLWEKITTVKGMGNKNSLTDYQVSDHSPLAGTSYYRLKQVDFDGQYMYSGLQSVKINILNFKVYPNPATDQVSIEASDIEKCEIQVSDLTGHIMQVNKKIKDGKAIIDLQGLANGCYIFRIVNSEQTQSVLVLVGD